MGRKMERNHMATGKETPKEERKSGIRREIPEANGTEGVARLKRYAS